MSNLPDVYILCGGDYNARTGSNPDFIEDDLLEYSENQNTSHWDFIIDFFNMRRFSADRTINNFGKTLLDLCSTLNIHIMNGRCGNDFEKGDFTYIGNNGTSLIDYLISSSVLFDYVNDFSIQTRTESDHLPITLSMKTDLFRPPDDSDKKQIRHTGFIGRTTKLNNLEKTYYLTVFNYYLINQWTTHLQILMIVLNM